MPRLLTASLAQVRAEKGLREGQGGDHARQRQGCIDDRQDSVVGYTKLAGIQRNQHDPECLAGNSPQPVDGGIGEEATEVTDRGLKVGWRGRGCAHSREARDAKMSSAGMSMVLHRMQ